jgi:phosphoribosyl 1,2-cyclic phosphate phosphodiesterase
MKVTVLGCGPSGGVPLIGNDWGACDPINPRNRRRRASILVQDGDATVLVDTSPDLREQLLEAGVGRVDAILYTHAHADHLHGIDEIRSLNRATKQAIPIYASSETLEEIRKRFGYIFAPVNPRFTTVFYKPALEPHIVSGPFPAAGIPVIPFVQDHGTVRSLGYRFGRFAYSTDLVRLDDAGFATLIGIDTWLVDCYRREPHPTHTHLAQTLEWIARVRPRRAILTHMDGALDYETLRRELPPGVEPAYDGLQFEL